LLSALFTASAVSTGAAAVTLAAERSAPQKTLEKLKTLETTGTVAELGLIGAYVLQSGRAARPLLEGRYRIPFWGGAVAAGGLLPLLLRAAARGHASERRVGRIAALLTILGSLALRW